MTDGYMLYYRISEPDKVCGPRGEYFILVSEIEDDTIEGHKIPGYEYHSRATVHNFPSDWPEDTTMMRVD